VQQQANIAEKCMRSAKGHNSYSIGNKILFHDSNKCHWTQKIACAKEGKQNLDVIWYSISDRSSFCSKVCCIVANPIRRGSRSPTRQLLISTPFFCLGLTSVGLASSNLSFRAPTKTAQTE
jgi:hypothetical protein